MTRATKIAIALLAFALAVVAWALVRRRVGTSGTGGSLTLNADHIGTELTIEEPKFTTIGFKVREEFALPPPYEPQIYNSIYIYTRPGYALKFDTGKIYGPNAAKNAPFGVDATAYQFWGYGGNIDLPQGAAFVPVGVADPFYPWAVAPEVRYN